jgi:drug/metabolite transporter (DMT)-like permease
MGGTFPYLGEIFATLTAITWASAVILFKKSGETVHPIALNLFKNFLAAILFLPTLWFFHIPLILNVPGRAYLLLIVSGVIGIGFSDTLFFTCLNRIGAGLSAIVTSTYSPFIIGLSIVFLGERLTVLQISGIVSIVFAVLITIYVKEFGKVTRRDLLWGIFWGILATATNAVGIVMIKPLLEKSPLLWVTEIRLIAGAFSLVFITILHPFRRTIVSSLFVPGGWLYTISGSFIGAYLAMLMWLAGMKFTFASTASALNQTSTIFVFILGALFLGEPITIKRIFAITLAILGIFLIFLG